MERLSATIDTKLLAKSDEAMEAFRGCYAKTHLNLLHSLVTGEAAEDGEGEYDVTQASERTAPLIEFAPGHERYAGDDGDAHHEAGFDAYVTGVVYLGVKAAIATVGGSFCPPRRWRGLVTRLGPSFHIIFLFYLFFFFFFFFFFFCVQRTSHDVDALIGTLTSKVTMVSLAGHPTSYCVDLCFCCSPWSFQQVAHFSHLNEYMDLRGEEEESVNIQSAFELIFTPKV